MLGITGDKMLSHLDRIVGDRRPITADVFLTNYCNNSCPYCTYRRWNLEDGAYSMGYDGPVCRTAAVVWGAGHYPDRGRRAYRLPGF